MPHEDGATDEDGPQAIGATVRSEAQAGESHARRGKEARAPSCAPDGCQGQEGPHDGEEDDGSASRAPHGAARPLAPSDRVRPARPGTRRALLPEIAGRRIGARCVRGYAIACDAYETTFERLDVEAWERATAPTPRAFGPGEVDGRFPPAVRIGYARAMGSAYATAELATPLGVLRMAATEKGLVRVGLPRTTGAGFEGGLEAAIHGSIRVRRLDILDEARRELEEYFAGRRRGFSVELDLRGTPFQCAVWRALVEIPFGRTCSYAEIARVVGNPRALRAVGAANAANPLPIVVPCHRVIAADGGLGGYSGGLDVKRWLLAHEKAIAPESLL